MKLMLLGQGKLACQSMVHSKMKKKTEIIYFDPSLNLSERRRFRDGEAWLVNPDHKSSASENFGILKISAVTYQGLFCLGIIEQLQELPNDGFLGDYEEGILFPAALQRAADIFDCAAATIGNEARDVLCLTQVQPRQVEYRMKLLPEEIKEGLKELAAFCRKAVSKGYGVQLWL